MTVGVRKILRKVPRSTAITEVVLNTQRFVESFVVFAVPLWLSHRRVGQVEVVLEATGEVLLVLVPEGIHEILERLLFLDAGKSTGVIVLGVGGGGLVFAAAPVLALHEKVVEVWLVLGE